LASTSSTFCVASCAQHAREVRRDAGRALAGDGRRELDDAGRPAGKRSLEREAQPGELAVEVARNAGQRLGRRDLGNERRFRRGLGIDRLSAGGSMRRGSA
jgi:hypothetical protein